MILLWCIRYDSRCSILPHTTLGKENITVAAVKFHNALQFYVLHNKYQIFEFLAQVTE